MERTNSNYNFLIAKIDEFTRKYYKNLLIRGALYFTGVFVLFFLTVTLLEYFGRFNTTGRTILFYTFLAVSAVITVRLIIIPLLKLYNMGKVISHRDAAIIIGTHFTDVKDKLLNVLQLNSLAADDSSGSSSLISAGIDQKIAELKPVPFTNAINLGDNRKYLKYALPPVIALVVLMLFYPGIIAESSDRLVNYNSYFAPKAPFQFNLMNKDLKVIQNQDFKLDLKLTGSEVPQEVFVEVGDVRYKMERENTIEFTYLFRNVKKDVTFHLVGDGYESQEYTLRALPNPIILNFEVKLAYPAYTGKQAEVIKNTGDFIVPEGTVATWVFATQNTQNLKMAFNDTAQAVSAAGADKYSLSARLLKSKTYSIATSNQYLSNRDSVRYSISVVPDQYPTIDAQEFKDTLSPKRLYFNGVTKDDYGFRRLTFNYVSVDEGGNPKGAVTSKDVPFTQGTTAAEFYYLWDLNTMALNPGDAFEYYFEVWDNDGVHGSKSSRSTKMVFRVPNLADVAASTDKSNKEIKDDLGQSIKDAKGLQKDLDELNKKLLNKKTMTYEDKKKLQDILKKQKDLEKKLDDIKKENSQKNQNSNSFSEEDQRILDKQQQLEKLLDDIMTPDLQKMLDDLQKMMDNLDKDKVQKMLDELKMTNKDIEKELDRSLEMFKRMEFDDKLQKTIDRLKDLSKEQDKLSEDTKKANTPEEQKDIQDKQDKINDEFDKLKKEMEDLEKKNKELETPNDFENPKGDQEDIQKDLKDSKENLDNKKNSKAAQSQKGASDKMQKMSDKLEKMQGDMEGEQSEEDLKSLRQLLENLIKLSFDQEELISRTGNTNINNPLYNKIMQDQKKLKDDGRMIEDSLLALSKRVPQISAIINREIADINSNMGKAINALEDRTTPQATNRQQFVMTAVNNLALMLSDVADQMQQSMPSSMSGKGSCKKPGKTGQKPSAGDMRKMQEKLNKDIKDMKDGMENGKKPGGQKGMSQGLAKMAAQQESIRRQLQGLADQIDKDGKNGNKGNLSKIMEDMEKTEKDIVNKNITEETLKRQQDILTRLLVAEKSERERDEDDKRESKEPKDSPLSNPSLFFEYNRKKLKETELLKTVPPALNLFYRTKVTDYFNNFENKQPVAPNPKTVPPAVAPLPGNGDKRNIKK
jgi:hypothetical protein